MLLERLNLKACSKQINHKMSKHFSILSKLWCNSNKQSKCVTDAIPLLLEYGKISKLYNIQMRNEGLCTKTGALNHISYCLTRGFKYRTRAIVWMCFSTQFFPLNLILKSKMIQDNQQKSCFVTLDLPFHQIGHKWPLLSMFLHICVAIQLWNSC